MRVFDRPAKFFVAAFAVGFLPHDAIARDGRGGDPTLLLGLLAVLAIGGTLIWAQKRSRGFFQLLGGLFVVGMPAALVAGLIEVAALFPPSTSSRHLPSRLLWLSSYSCTLRPRRITVGREPLPTTRSNGPPASARWRVPSALRALAAAQRERLERGEPPSRG